LSLAERHIKIRPNFSKREAKPPTPSLSLTAIDFTAPQLTELALAIKSGDVFCSWMVNGMDGEQLKTVFIPLNNQELKPLKLTYNHEEAEDVVHVFQHVKASFFNKPNGYPTFRECFGLKQKYAKPLMNELARLDQEMGENG